MFYNIFIKLQFLKIKHDYNHNNLLNFKKAFTQKLTELKSNVINSTYMTESNGCITLEITVENKNYSSEIILNSLKSSFCKNINGLEIDIDSEYTTFIVNDNNLLNFNSKQHEALINIEDIPENINHIVVNSKMAFSLDDTPEFIFSFLDCENNEVNYKPEWIDAVNNIYSHFFKADQAMDIKLGSVRKMLLGDNYQEILKNSHFKIVTEFMDDFDLFEKNKIEDNVVLTFC